MNNEDAVKASPPSHMARHQVLTNYELVSVVMSSFNCKLGTAEGRATLFKAALVCKSFTGPALDALWERMDSFIPILKLLPELREYESSYYFHGSIVISPFLEYAKRVRELTIPTIEEEIAFSGQVFARLAKQLNGKPLLPGLVRIRIEDVDNMASNLIPLLSSPSVSALEFRGESLARSHLHQSLFPSLDVDFPFLESLSLEDSSSSFEHHDDILPLLLKLTGLQSLEIHIPGTIVQPEFLESLGRKLPRLRHLSLDITLPHSDSVCPSGSQYGPEMFPSLESLHLTLRDGSTCHFHSSSITICSTFDPLLLSRLTSMTIFMSQPTGSVTDLKRVLLRAPNFQRLTLTQAKDDVEHDPHLEDVLSLLEIPTLEELVIDTNYIDFSDEREEETLAQILVDAAYGASNTKRKTTLRALVLPVTADQMISSLEYIARNAPGLKKLSIGINSSIECIPTWRSTPIPSTLRHLEISDMRPSKSHFTLMENSRMAEYLDRIFPNLESMNTYTDSRGRGGRHTDNWEFIEHLRKKEKAYRSLFNEL